jgi:hypothetical protein
MCCVTFALAEAFTIIVWCSVSVVPQRQQVIVAAMWTAANRSFVGIMYYVVYCSILSPSNFFG